MSIFVVLENQETGEPVQFRTVTMQDWDQGVVGNLTTDANGALVVDEKYRNQEVIFHTTFLEPGEESGVLRLGGWISLNQDTVSITVRLLSSAPGQKKGEGITIRLKLAKELNAPKSQVEWVSERNQFSPSGRKLNLCAQTVYRESIFGKKVTALLFNNRNIVECTADENGDIVLDEKYLNDQLSLSCEIRLPSGLATLQGDWQTLDAGFFEYSMNKITIP